MQKPSVGRIVHYFERNNPDVPYAAIVVDVHEDGSPDLRIFNHGAGPTDDALATHVDHRDSDQGSGFWDWPARV